MANYNNVYISRDTFESYRNEGLPYTGFVIGEGYAFVQFQTYSQLMNGAIVSSHTPKIPITEFYIPYIVQIQCIDSSKEMIKKSLRGLFKKSGCAIYVVCEGDTLTSIADMFDVTVDELSKWNKLTNNNSLSIGQKILVLDILERKIIDIPMQLESGEIREASPLTSYEFWLDSPSTNLLEGIWKIANNVGYGFVNSPVKLFTGRSIGGSNQLPQDRFEAFLDVLPIAFFKGIKILGFCKKVTPGLRGYNSFIKSKQYQLNKALGKGWQKQAGRQFQQAKDHYMMNKTTEEFWDKIGKGINAWDEYSKEEE